MGLSVCVCIKCTVYTRSPLISYWLTPCTFYGFGRTKEIFWQFIIKYLRMLIYNIWFWVFWWDIQNNFVLSEIWDVSERNRSWSQIITNSFWPFTLALWFPFHQLCQKDKPTQNRPWLHALPDTISLDSPSLQWPFVGQFTFFWT